MQEKRQIVLKKKMNNHILYARILAWLIHAYLTVHLLSVKRYIHKYIFGQQADDLSMQPYIKEIRLTRRLIRLLPIRITCLMESMAIQNLLKGYGTLAPICLGVKKGDGFMAHAWIMEDTQYEFKSLFE